MGAERTSAGVHRASVYSIQHAVRNFHFIFPFDTYPCPSAVLINEFVDGEDPVSLPYGPEYLPENDLDFQESLVVESSLGGGAQADVCEQLVTSTNGRFCVLCLESLQGRGVNETLKHYDAEGDCAKCEEQCLLLVAPNKGTDLS